MAKAKVIELTIQKVIGFLREKINISEAFLFGSYAVGKPRAESDIDLAIFSPDVEKWTIEQKARLAAEVKLRCSADIELHLFPASLLKEARPTNFFGYILKTGKKVT